MEKARSQCFDGVLPGTYCTYVLHQNIATFPCLSTHFPMLFSGMRSRKFTIKMLLFLSI